MTALDLNRILIVDDEPAIVDLMEFYLESDYEIIRAYNGKEALEKARLQKPSVIILDVMMPDMNGFEVCILLKNSPGTQFIPIIMVTALSDKEVSMKAMESGADELLSKPVNRFDLLMCVKVLVNITKMRSSNGFDFGRALVLIVDDEPVYLDRMESFLKWDYEIIKAYNGKEALEKAKSEKPSAIILDVMMPEIDGYEVCKLLKNSPETQFIPIIMVTALSGRDEKIKGFELGVDGFFTKPVNMFRLGMRVRLLTRSIIEVRKMMNIACYEARGTSAEKVICGFNKQIKELKIGNFEDMKTQVQKLYRTLRSSVPVKEEYREIHREIELILQEEDLVYQYSSLNVLIPQIIQINKLEEARGSDVMKNLIEVVNKLQASIDDLQNPQGYLEIIQRNLEEIKKGLPKMEEEINQVLIALYSPLSTDQKLKIAIPLIPTLVSYEIETNVPEFVVDRIYELRELVLKLKKEFISAQ